MQRTRFRSAWAKCRADETGRRLYNEEIAGSGVTDRETGPVR